MHLKLFSKRAIQKTTKPTADLIGSKIGNKIRWVSKNWQQNNAETVTNENDKEIPKYPKERQEDIDDLRLK